MEVLYLLGICENVAGYDITKRIFSVFTIDSYCDYRKTSNIRRTIVGNKIVDRSDVIGASPVGAAPTTSSFST